MEAPLTIRDILMDVWDCGFTVDEPKTEGMSVDEALKQIKAIIEERVIGEGVPMTFKNTYPVFNSLEEYIEHVSLIRKVQRDEQRQALKQVLKGEEQR